MEVAVWDTYVSKKDGSIMHFDIIVPNSQTSTELIYAFGNEYLKLKAQEGQILSSNECSFCHIEKATPQMIESIRNKGYFIVEMEGCS